MEKLNLNDFLKYHFISGLNSIEKDKVFMLIAKAKDDKTGYDKNLYLYDKETITQESSNTNSSNANENNNTNDNKDDEKNDNIVENTNDK